MGTFSQTPESCVLFAISPYVQLRHTFFCFPSFTRSHMTVSILFRAACEKQTSLVSGVFISSHNDVSPPFLTLSNISGSILSNPLVNLKEKITVDMVSGITIIRKSIVKIFLKVLYFLKKSWMGTIMANTIISTSIGSDRAGALDDISIWSIWSRI